MTCPVCFQVGTCEVSWCTTFAGAKPAGIPITCVPCGSNDGWHAQSCPSYPKNGNKLCVECGWYNGKHHPTACRRRGYAAVGHHPSNPDAAAARPAPVAPRIGARCECGVDATGVGGMHSSWCAKAVAG